MKFNDSWRLTRQTLNSKKYHAPCLENKMMNLLTVLVSFGQTVADKSCHNFFGTQGCFSSFMADTGDLVVWMTLILLSMFTQIIWTVVCTQNIVFQHPGLSMMWYLNGYEEFGSWRIFPLWKISPVHQHLQGGVQMFFQ